MEWVSVCSLPVFVPSEAEKVGKFPSGGTKLLPSSGFQDLGAILRLFGGKCGVCGLNLQQFAALNALGHLRDDTDCFSAAVCEKLGGTCAGSE